MNSLKQLQRWILTSKKDGTYRENITRIYDTTLENFQTSNNKGLIVHEEDLRGWALQAQKEIGHDDFRFPALKNWLTKFKSKHRIVFRRKKESSLLERLWKKSMNQK